MAAPRAYWKGHLRLSLVSIAIELYPAVKSGATISLNQIHKPSGKRVRYQKIVPGIGPVDTDDIVKGFEIEKGEYVLLEPEEIDEVKIEAKRTIDLVQFVEHCEIDPRFFHKPYYVKPEGEVATEGFVVIREALRDSKKVGLGQMAVRGRDYICAIKPCGDGLLLETLRFAEEVRDSDVIFDDIDEVDYDAEMLDLAKELIARKAGPFEPEVFKERYTAALRALIEEKHDTGAVARSDGEAPKGGGNVVDLMEALKKSVAKEKGGKKKSAKKRASG